MKNSLAVIMCKPSFHRFVKNETYANKWGISIGIDTGLYGEVGLREGDLLFSRIVILGDQIAGVASHHDVADFPLAVGAEFNHFSDIGKMVSDIVPRHLAGRLGFGDGVEKIVPLGINQQVL